MPTVSNGPVSLFYVVDGDGETVAFVPEAGLSGWSWGWQHAAVAGPYRVLVWDLRGTGRSGAPPGPYDLETLTADFETVLATALAETGARRAHVVGAGLGGAISLATARNSTLIETLTLLGTGARSDQFDLEALRAPPDDPSELRNSLEEALSADFRGSQPDVVDGIVDWRADDADEECFQAQVAALDGFDATDWGYEVTQPTLVVHGTADELVSVDAGRELAETLPRGEFVPIQDAGHLCQVEHSREVNDRLLGFLDAHTDDGR